MNEKSIETSGTRMNTQSQSRRQLIILILIAISVASLATVVVVESYFYLELIDSHAVLQELYLELNTSFQALNISYSELLSELREFYGNVTVEQSKLLIETKPDLIIVDVRFPDEYEDGHIEGAINICVICYPEELEKLDLNAEILVYCHSGFRSMNALQILTESDHYKVYNMLGGIIAWMEADYPIATKE